MARNMKYTAVAPPDSQAAEEVYIQNLPTGEGDAVGVASITLTVTNGTVTAGTWKDTNGDSHVITIES